MSYKDPEQQRTYQRLRRGGSCQTPSQTQLPAEFRLQTAHDVLDLIVEQVQAVRDEKDAGTLEKARVVGYLAGIALKAVEVADFHRLLCQRAAKDAASVLGGFDHLTRRVADASLRYGRLWRQGITYSTLMMNNINHPNTSGMGLFADALMSLFP
jgi:hypothetical protein